MAVVANHQGAATAEVANVQKDNPAAVSMQSSKTNLSSVPVTAQVPQHPNVTFKAAKPTAASISSGGSTGSKRSTVKKARDKFFTEFSVNEGGAFTGNIYCKNKCNGLSCLQRLEAQTDSFVVAQQISKLFKSFNPLGNDKFDKGNALLSHMHSYENRVYNGQKKKIRWQLPDCPSMEICVNCWLRCAGFYDEISHDRNATFKRALSAFNKGMTKLSKKTSDKSAHAAKHLRVLTFLQEWSTHAGDLLPDEEEEDESMCYDSKSDNDGVAGLPVVRKRIHVDVALKSEIWEACCNDLEDEAARDGFSYEGKHPVSKEHFLAILRKHYKVIIHKYKQFAKCQACFTYKSHLAAAKTAADRAFIRRQQALHYRIIYLERCEYHRVRRLAMRDPRKTLSMISDSISKWKTELPLFNRDLKLAGFHAYGNQLLTCLVHRDCSNNDNPGGAFNYLVDDAVTGGGNVTVECVWRTLQQLQQLRKDWSEEFHLQVDNTTKENKNHTLFGFMAWLVHEKVFAKTTISFLPVGHTHEDIDALFGVVARFLRKHTNTVMTHKELEDLLWQSLQSPGNRSETRTSWKPCVATELVKGTHDWKSWTQKPSAAAAADPLCPSTAESPIRPMRKLERFALTGKGTPDNVRPHRFEFKLAVLGDGREVVVMNYYHWCNDNETWNETPISVFNYAPKAEWLQPAELNPQKTLKIRNCEAADWGCGKENCPCCSVFAAFKEGACYDPATACTNLAETRQYWIDWFMDTNNESAAASLPPFRGSLQPRSVVASDEPCVTVTLPNGCIMPDEDLLPPVVVHNGTGA